jgi:ABC-2 type transport system permease protein
MMEQLKHTWFITMLNLKRFVNDKTALFFFIVFPFIFVLIFNFMLKGVGSEDERLKLHLSTMEAPGGLSYQIIGAMETKDPEQLAPGAPQIVWDQDYVAARQQVADKKLSGFLLFPADFTQAVMMGYGTKLEVVVNPANTTIQAALNSLAANIASQVGTEQLALNTAISLSVEQSLTTGNMTDLGEEIGGIVGSTGTSMGPSLISFQTEKVGDVEAENPANYVIPGYLVMFTFFAAAQTASVIVLERQNNTLERLLSSSAKRQSILAGMFLGTIARGLIQIIIFWTVGALVFKIDLGASPLAVILLSVLMVLVSAAFSIMLATLVKTEKAAGSLGVLIALVLAPLGGCWWPLFIEPRWMQSIAKLIPHGWANEGFNTLMVFGGQFNAVIPNLIALAAFAIVFGIIAVMRFRTDAV